MPCCPNCADVEMISMSPLNLVRGTSCNQVGPRCCPSCGYGE